MSRRPGGAKGLFAEAYDAAATGFAASADRLVYAYLARPEPPYRPKQAVMEVVARRP